MIEDQLRRAQEQLHFHEERIRNQRAEIERLERERDSANAKIADIVNAAEEAGWNGVENSKILTAFIRDLARERDEAREAARYCFQSAKADGVPMAYEFERWSWLEEST